MFRLRLVVAVLSALVAASFAYSSEKTHADLSICSRTEFLHDNGTFLKMLCTVNVDVDYEKANTICTDAGMKLFTIDNEKVKKAFLNAIQSQSNCLDYARLYVNGRKNSDGQWMTSDRYSKPVFAGLEWYQGWDMTPAGDCLSVVRHNIKENMAFHGVNCTKIAWTFCEFDIKFDDSTDYANEFLWKKILYQIFYKMFK